MNNYMSVWCFLYLIIYTRFIVCEPVKDEFRRVVKLTEKFSVTIRIISYIDKHPSITPTTQSPTYFLIYGPSCKYVSDISRLSSFYDVTDVADSVTNQYLSLPYPPVSRQTLKDEIDHYKREKRGTPFQFLPPLSLEAINQLQFKGLNSFRCTLNTS